MIKLESYNTNIIEKNRVLHIVESCQDDYITIGHILTNNNLKLNCFFLKQSKYFLYGFLNLYNLDNSPYNLPNNEIDYLKEWHNLLSQQLVEIFLKHFYNLKKTNH